MLANMAPVPKVIRGRDLKRFKGGGSKCVSLDREVGLSEVLNESCVGVSENDIEFGLKLLRSIA